MPQSISAVGPFSTSPLIFQASRLSQQSPHVLYSSNRGLTAAGQTDNFNLSYKVVDDPAAVTARHQQLRQQLGRPLAVVRQVHSATVIDLDDFLAAQSAQPPSGQPSQSQPQSLEQSLAALAEVEADALVSSRCDIALGIYTADCTPVLLADSARRVFGAVHAGRRGVENGVLPAALDAMVTKGAQLAQTEVWLGPNICGTCYETGSELANGFAQALSGRLPGLDLAAATDRFTTRTRFGGAGIDMRAALLAQLAEAGLSPSLIHDHDQAIGEQTRQALVGRSAGISEDSLTSDPAADPAPAMAATPTPEPAVVPARTEAQVQAQSQVQSFNPLCTLENPLLYSYREFTLTQRPGSNGRFLSIVLPELD